MIRPTRRRSGTQMATLLIKHTVDANDVTAIVADDVQIDDPESVPTSRAQVERLVRQWLHRDGDESLHYVSERHADEWPERWALAAEAIERIFPEWAGEIRNPR